MSGSEGGVDDRVAALLEGLFDYAGLFPPAGLGMTETVRNYASYRVAPRAWMLGRLVVPWSRRREFLEALSTEWAVEDSGRDSQGPGPCPVTLLVPLPAGDDERDRLRGQHAKFSEAATGRVEVGALEAKADSVDRLADLSINFDLFGDLFPAAEVHVEATASCSLEKLLDVLVEQRERTGRGAGKLRTGSVVPEEIPPVDEVVGFIRACARRDLPWKATAGLHHPLPAVRPLTYESDAPHGAMYGYLGVILAAARAIGEPGGPAAHIRALLTNSDPPHISDLSAASIRTARTRGCLSIGSCSFVEPVEGAESLGLLPHSNASSP